MLTVPTAPVLLSRQIGLVAESAWGSGRCTGTSAPPFTANAGLARVSELCPTAFSLNPSILAA